MRFWDSSALVTLCLDHPKSAHARKLIREDNVMVACWGSTVECASAIERVVREDRLTSSEEQQANSLLHELSESWFEIQPGNAVRDQALRVLRLHPLRSADALQLAAALEWSGPTVRGAFIT